MRRIIGQAFERLRSRVERTVGIKEGVVTLPRVPRDTPPPPSPATRSKPPSRRPPPGAALLADCELGRLRLENRELRARCERLALEARSARRELAAARGVAPEA